ncbi:uncharacterized protein LOC122838837 isoform X2 [Gambusia affinis]|uniref:uncharacterized protein LOC122838837 isoform X2 n=1 Tax=Gambusia affinis TaxID=33528 RepID=UPI001CDBDD0F|nr:uncharacterized protein LOC122838837 isoform X2 [Gambusia affinis]
MRSKASGNTVTSQCIAQTVEKSWLSRHQTFVAIVARSFKKFVRKILHNVQHNRVFHPALPQPSATSMNTEEKKKRGSTKVFSWEKQKEKMKVRIHIGLMTIQKNCLKPQRGKIILLATNPDVSATPLLSLAVKKMKDFNKDIEDGPFLLLYPDGTEVINIPGTQTPFTLADYKAEIGKSYQRISLFLCLKRDFEEVGKSSDSSDSDPEIVIRKSEFDLADTLPWEPMNESSPLQNVAETENGAGDLVLANEVQQVMDLDNNGNNPGTSQCLTVQSYCYRDYTTLFKPIVIDDDDEIEYFTEDKKQDLTPEEHVKTNVQPHDIIAELAKNIDHKKVSRFNICRTDVWDGAVRGFQRSTYSDKNDMFINDMFIMFINDMFIKHVHQICESSERCLEGSAASAVSLQHHV